LPGALWFCADAWAASDEGMRNLSLSFSLVLLPALLAARPFTVVTYNVENLHDADGVAVYEDYQPARYTPAHVLTKLQNIAAVLAKFEEGRGPDVVLFNEIELDQTPGKTVPDYTAMLARYKGMTIEAMLGAAMTPEIADLPAESLLLKALADRGLTGYTVVTGGDGVGRHEDGNARAITCVVFTRFPVRETHTYPVPMARNILEVKLDVEGYPFTVFNNHWKSGASEAATELIRIEGARVLRARVDGLLKSDPQADFLIGGDLNSHYNQKRRYRSLPATAINDTLGSQGNENAVRGPSRDLYNLWFELPEAERGSDTFKGEWGTLMHLIISRGLYDLRGIQYVDNSFGVARFPGLNADSGGVPVRWTEEPPAGRGFSDHFPIFARFTTTDENRPDKFIPLTKASGAETTSEVATHKVDMRKTDFASAIVLAKLPPGTDLQDGTWTGKLFRIEAPALRENLLRIEVGGQTYDVFSRQKPVREALQAQRRADGKLTCYGELGTYKGNWQFLVKSIDWVR
jgi:hypothetical protein